VDKVVGYLPFWKGRGMNRSGRLALIKSTLSTVPIYISISIGLPAWVYKAFEKIMKGFLWTKTEEVKAGKCLVAWGKVQRPLAMGGLGIIDLQRMDLALSLRWLWLQFTDWSHPWVGLPALEDLTALALFKCSTISVLGDGQKFRF
jgi:hypothetical protein